MNKTAHSRMIPEHYKQSAFALNKSDTFYYFRAFEPIRYDRLLGFAFYTAVKRISPYNLHTYYIVHLYLARVRP